MTMVLAVDIWFSLGWVLVPFLDFCCLLWILEDVMAVDCLGERASESLPGVPPGVWGRMLVLGLVG